MPKKSIPPKKTKKPADKRYEAFRKVSSPKEKMLVAKYGTYYLPSYDAEGTHDMRTTVFRYVLETFQKHPSKLLDDKLELYKCLENALLNGDGMVFRFVAESVDVITKAHRYGWAYPDAVMLLSEYYPEELSTNRQLWEVWGWDMVPPPDKILAKYGRRSDIRHIRRLAAILGLQLNTKRPGRPLKIK